MHIIQDIIEHLSIANNVNIIPEDVYRKLIEYIFLELTDANSINITSLLPTKIDIIKELHAALTTATLRFIQHNEQNDGIIQALTKDCKYTKARADFYLQQYQLNRIKLECKLGNIGTHLPHIVDVKWDIDYILKRDVLDASEGPFFRISLITEQYNVQQAKKEVTPIKFTCTAQEMQDLVYKLKDALRHCQKIGGS